MENVITAVHADLPWLVLAYIFAVMAYIILKLIGVMHDAFGKNQTIVAATVTPPPPREPSPDKAPAPAPEPKPAQSKPPEPSPTPPHVAPGPAPLQTEHIDLADLKTEYLQDWSALVISPEHAGVVQNDARKIIEFRAAYEAVSAATNNIPWWLIGIIDMMEGGGGADTNPCNGQTLKRRTTNVPAGRPPAPLQPPFTFQQAAVDAMTYMGFDKITNWTIDVVSWTFEKQNGFGYRKFHNRRSPYLYGFSNLEQPGKYTSDRHFDETAKNEQAGALTMLKAMMLLDPTITL